MRFRSEMHYYAWFKTYQSFSENIKKQSKALKNLLINLKKNKKKVVGYGASTKGNVILQHAKINENLLPLILDVNKFKFGKFTPGTQIKIISEKTTNFFFSFRKKSDHITMAISVNTKLVDLYKKIFVGFNSPAYLIKPDISNDLLTKKIIGFVLTNY